jgi:hypothetical protein
MKALVAVLIISTLVCAAQAQQAHARCSLYDGMADRFWASLIDGLSPTARSPTLMHYVEDMKAKVAEARKWPS